MGAKGRKQRNARRGYDNRVILAGGMETRATDGLLISIGARVLRWDRTVRHVACVTFAARS